MSISQTLLPEFDEEMANTRKLLALVPDGKFDFKPHEKSATLKSLAGHIADLPSLAIATIDEDSFNLEADHEFHYPETTADLLAVFDKNVIEARKRIERASDEHLSKIWTFRYAGQDVFSAPRSVILRSSVMNHHIHHRAQLSVYLRLNDVEFPGMYGPSADEMKFWDPPAKS